jgi:putative SOS response-associated peptidase YedK
MAGHRNESEAAYFIRMKDKEPFAFAGLWDEWTAPEGETVQSYSIITTDPNEVMMPIHNRMPAILSANDYTTWLDPEELPDALKGLLKSYDPGQMEAYPVSTFCQSTHQSGAEMYRAVGDDRLSVCLEGRQ